MRCVSGQRENGVMSDETSETALSAASPSPFLQNAWYVAGFAEDLGVTPLLGRTILGQPVLLYRNEDGTVAAIGNRCPHRFAPLSLGKVIGAQVRCGYHGLGFDRTGKCVHNPHGPTGSLAVPAYPLIERSGLLWIWMGDRGRADAAHVPDFDNLDETISHVRRGYLHGNANYQLMTDNILDLSHIEFLHPALGTEAVSRAKVEVAQEGETLRTVRSMKNEILPPGLAYVYKSADQVVDRRMAVTWHAPANMVLNVTVTPVDKAAGWQTSTQTLHLFTPETEQSTHYFYVGSLPRQTSDAQTADRFFTALSKAFLHEDKPMIDAQARMIGAADIMTLKPALLPPDKAAVLARRMLARRIADERI